MLSQKVNDALYSVRTSRVKLFRKIHGKPLWAVQPMSLQIDTHSACSLRCKYCNPQACYVENVSQRILPMSTLDRLLEMLSEKKVFINYARPWMNGDPLLELRLKEINKKIKKALGARIDIFTNGVEYKNRHLLHDSNINDIRFTISAANEELYNTVHGRPKFSEALKTLEWVTRHKYFYQRLWINFILFDENAHNLADWQKMFQNYRQDVRCLHFGEGRNQSKQLTDFDVELKTRRDAFFRSIEQQEKPCPCFGNMAISSEGKMLQCCDVDYKFNWGHIEEIDVMEAYRKRLDAGLNHIACRNCNQKNPHWKELFEKYVWA